MHYENIEFHNCAELNDCDGFPSPQRVPEAVRRELNPGAQDKVLDPGSAEIRFVLEPGRKVTITLSSVDVSHIAIFFGDLRHGDVFAIRNEPTPIEIAWNPRLLQYHEALRAHPYTFLPQVVRLMMMGENLAAALRPLIKSL